MLQSRGEQKYDLQLVNTLKDRRPKDQPWYKERLHTKHIKEGGRSNKHLNGANWTFIKDGLDDFRDGFPIEPQGGGLIKPDKGAMPLDSVHRNPKQQVKPKLTKHQVLYSRTLPGQERRRQNLDHLIQGLREHPLALHPHMEDSVPSEMFEDLVDTLDPEMKLGQVDDDVYNEMHDESPVVPGSALSSRLSAPESAREEQKTEDENKDKSEKGSSRFEDDKSEKSESFRDESQPKPETLEAAVKPQSQPRSQASQFEELPTEEPPMVSRMKLMQSDKEMSAKFSRSSALKRETYEWPSVHKAKQFWQQVSPEDYRTTGFKWLPPSKDQSAAAQALSQAEDDHIRQVAKDFCDWVAALGGDSNNIDESTVAGLFSGGYESKPALSAPIHVVELTNVPAELRMNSAAQSRDARGSSAQSSNSDRLLQPGYVQTKPVKNVRYGAWYLKPDQWKALKPGEQFRDPREMQENFSESKKKSNALDLDLVHMHGAKEFIKFMREKGHDVPEFLQKVAELQEEHEKKERHEQAAKTDNLKQVNRSAAAAKSD